MRVIAKIFYLLSALIIIASLGAVNSFAGNNIQNDVASSLGIDINQFRRIAQTVMAPGGIINKELHDEFWSLLPKKIANDPQQLKEFIITLDTRPAMEFQTETWKSIKNSFLNGKISWTPGFTYLSEKMLEGNSPAAELSRPSVDHAKAMIEAAASHKPYKLSDGREINLNAEMADNILKNIPPAIERLNRLFDPAWN